MNGKKLVDLVAYNFMGYQPYSTERGLYVMSKNHVGVFDPLASHTDLHKIIEKLKEQRKFQYVTMTEYIDAASVTIVMKSKEYSANGPTIQLALLHAVLKYAGIEL